MIVCVEAAPAAGDEAASASSEDTEAVDEGTEAEEEEQEEEEEGGERDTCSPPSPCHVLDGHFDALTALANEGRNSNRIFPITITRCAAFQNAHDLMLFV